MSRLTLGILMPMDTRWMGGVTYIQNLLKVLAVLPAGERARLRIVLIVSEETDPGLYRSLQPLIDHCSLHRCLNLTLFNRVRRRLGRLLPIMEDRCLATIARRERIDFLFPVMGGFGASLDLPCAWGGWIPDFQHRYLPDFFSATDIEAREREITSLERHASVLVFSSEVAQRDFEQFYPSSSITRTVLRFRTVGETSWFEGEPDKVQRQYGLPERFFLVSNQFWRHKNHGLVFEALRLLAAQGQRPVVACTGDLHDYRFPSYGDELLARVRDDGLEEQVRFLGLIPRDDQIQLMRRSLAVIQPSLFEGWSTVVEDARVLGKSLILSDLDVHVEQAPPHAHFFDRTSPSALADALVRALPGLEPGPHRDREAEARTANAQYSLEYAEQFLRIARVTAQREESL